MHFEAPPSSAVADEMAQFCRWFNDSGPGGTVPPPALAGVEGFIGGLTAGKYMALRRTGQLKGTRYWLPHVSEVNP